MKSITRFVLFLTTLMGVTYCVEGKTNCDTLGINFYEKIGCAKQNSSGDCPSFSDCKYERPPGKCLLNGAVVENREHLLDDKVECNFACTCIAQDNEKGIFVCAEGQCEHWHLPPNPNCYIEHELNDCCGRRRCEPSKVSCVYDGKTYKEGQKFSALDECSECICASGFNGKIEGPHCQRQSCPVEVRHTADIEQSCAPVYFVHREDELKCCPLLFMCPSNGDKYTGTSNSELTCKYGDKTVKSGVTVTNFNDRYGKNRTVTCECKLPPLLTCIMKY